MVPRLEFRPFAGDVLGPSGRNSKLSDEALANVPVSRRRGISKKISRIRRNPSVRPLLTCESRLFGFRRGPEALRGAPSRTPLFAFAGFQNPLMLKSPNLLEMAPEEHLVSRAYRG